MAVAAVLKRLVANRLLAPKLADDLVYWRSQRLYWEGMAHLDGGEREEEAEIHAAEGAETAIRRLADHASVETLPGEDLTYNLALSRLLGSLEDEERSALKTLDRLGPSRRIALGERMHDYMEASNAEAALEQVDRIHEYAEWLYQIGSADRTNRAGNDEGARA
jgi:hypothetical protein